MTVTGSGKDIDIVVLTVSATTDTQIAFHNQQSYNSVLIRERTANGIQLRPSPSDSDYLTLSAGATLTLDVMSDTKGQYGLWIRSASGTSTVELLGVYGG